MSNRAIRQHLELLLNSGIRELYEPSSQARTSLEQLANQYANCQKCALHEGRVKFVYGEGDPHAGIMVIGEGPGEQENLSGRPFVGRAGDLLNKMLAAINLRREQVYIANIVKCRPPGNRNPLPEERIACLPYLIEQIQIIQPQIFLMMGLVAAQTLLSTNEAMGVLREREHVFMDRPAFVTYHPAALLRNEHWKRPAWEDLQRFQKAWLEMASGQRP
ncbi:MAG TPA: uracil-DNA glycosylase [Candidatus Cloacimonadota bacterium]|nr:uracil-DNA glycosylase [Candidatus Cloacimonadota bacterium]HPN41642.1 uracil-DNA glycosylase [Candidatus Cloacimonadota bacterium]